MTQELHKKWGIAFCERKSLLMNICELRPAKLPNDEKYRKMANQLSRHFYTFRTKDKKIVVLDDPYILSSAIERQQYLLHLGWQLQRLPTRMSLRVAGKCQPSLWAAPNTQVDLKFLLTLLETALFTGNMVLRDSFKAAGWPCTLT